MKTVIVNGSYNTDGQCDRFIDMFNEGIGGEVINVRDYAFAGCRDCNFCREFGKCRIEDGMDNIFERVMNADILTVASPIYFGSLTGDLLNFFSRFQKYYLGGGVIKNKKGIVLLTGGGSTRVFDLPLRQAKIILKFMGAEFVGSAEFMGADFMEAEESVSSINELKKIKEKVYGKGKI